MDKKLFYFTLIIDSVVGFFSILLSILAMGYIENGDYTKAFSYGLIGVQFMILFGIISVMICLIAKGIKKRETKRC